MDFEKRNCLREGIQLVLSRKGGLSPRVAAGLNAAMIYDSAAGKDIAINARTSPGITLLSLIHNKPAKNGLNCVYSVIAGRNGWLISLKYDISLSLECTINLPASWTFPFPSRWKRSFAAGKKKIKKRKGKKKNWGKEGKKKIEGRTSSVVERGSIAERRIKIKRKKKKKENLSMPAHYAANETSSFFIRTRTRVPRCYFSVNFCQAASLCAVLFGGGDGDLKDRSFFF